jgi:nuclear pore complex protein Nup85
VLSRPEVSLSDSTVYFAAPGTVPDPVFHFYTETYTLFTSLQRIVASSVRLPPPTHSIDPRGFGMAEAWDKAGRLVGVEGLLGPPGAETVGHMRRLVGMYLEEITRLREEQSLEVRFSIA